MMYSVLISLIVLLNTVHLLFSLEEFKLSMTVFLQDQLVFSNCDPDDMHMLE